MCSWDDECVAASNRPSAQEGNSRVVRVDHEGGCPAVGDVAEATVHQVSVGGLTPERLSERQVGVYLKVVR
jgi:hypothetical protein